MCTILHAVNVHEYKAADVQLVINLVSRTNWAKPSQNVISQKISKQADSRRSLAKYKTKEANREMDR